MATIKEINHDSSTTIGDFYDNIGDTSGAATVTVPSRLNQSVNGVDVDMDSGVTVITLNESITPNGTNDFRFRFRIKLDNLTNSNSGVAFCWIDINYNTLLPLVRLEINGNAGDSGYNIKGYYFQSGKGGTLVQIGAGSDAISSTGDTCLEMSVIENSPGDVDIDILVNGSSVRSTAGIADMTTWTTLDQMQATFDPNASINGNIFYDEFILDDDFAASGLCVLALTLAPMIAKIADVDAAGVFIYIALLQGTPILTKISTALDADGTTVFDPGAGDNIGVECGRFSSDTVWVAGNFDGTNVVEKSEDAGSSFVVKDDATIGDVRSFVMGPDSDERILVFDETNGDILETRDDGTSWDSVNASVTPEVNAIARLGKNVEEAVFGNDGGANNSINYSVNSGDDLEDFQTGVYPNANATGVIVN